MKQNINLKMILKNLLMLIFMIAFITVFGYLFGVENNLAGVAISTALTMFTILQVEMNLKSTIFSIIASFLLIGLAPYLSNLNPFLGILINFISVFIIMYIYKENESSKNYMPFMLGYVFLQGNPISLNGLWARLASLLTGGILVSIVYYICHRKKEHSETSINQVFRSIDIHTIRFNYALRMAIGITFAMFIGQIFHFPKAMWISITVMSLTQPHTHQTKDKIKARTVGTMIGAILFVILFVLLVPHEYSFILALILNYLYMFVERYDLQMVFITMNSLSAAQLLLGTNESIFLRICFVLLGVLIAWLVDKTHYQIMKKRQFQNFVTTSSKIVSKDVKKI